MSKRTTDAAEAEAAHLEDVEDGCGCAEIWETLSEQRRAGRPPRGEQGGGPDR